MPRFVTIGYGNEEGYLRTDATVRAEAHACDERLVSEGAIVGVAGGPVQVRNPNAEGQEVTTGPFLSSRLPVAGFGIIEADSLEDAIGKVSGTPCAVAHGVVEVWPLREAAG